MSKISGQGILIVACCQKFKFILYFHAIQILQLLVDFIIKFSMICLPKDFRYLTFIDSNVLVHFNVLNNKLIAYYSVVLRHLAIAIVV